MEKIYNEYIQNLRNLAAIYIEKYRDDKYQDFTDANEFLLNYSFGKMERGEKIIILENNFMNSVDKLFNLEKMYEDSFVYHEK